ncbi:MAG: uracil-DNA glycosylase [Euryarchaeota archaeon]|nr:uracil-DNA glycosylase [Euryarchaeota archaeon]
MEPPADLDRLCRRVAACRRCPRLVSHREETARSPPPRHRGEDYWGRPLPGWGDPRARLLVVGLAPAAHGGNRTGRMFTGDSSGTTLMRAMHRAGFASKPDSVSRDDGLLLKDAYITAVVRCAPPGNRPTPRETENCRGYLAEELELLRGVRAILCLGNIAFQGTLAALAERGAEIPRPRPRFGHGARHRLGPYTVICSYHPSRQNTNTGRLTQGMLDRVFLDARRLSAARPRGGSSGPGGGSP